jgi:NDP-sugar pyrophosphorylase family protein
MVQAIILLGGKGTRLSRLFPDRPKALAPVAGKPFLQWQLAWLARRGVRAIHLAAGHLADRISAWLDEQATAASEGGRWEVEGADGKVGGGGDRGKGGWWRVEGGGATLDVGRSGSPLMVTLSVEPAPLGTGGGLKYVESHVCSDPFLVLNGDTLLPNLDLAALEQAHRQARPVATLAAARLRQTGRYGTIEVDKQNRIRAFLEKAERSEGLVNGGVYLAERSLLAAIEPGKTLSLETDIFPALAAQGRLQAFPVPPPLLDMGTPEGLAAMEQYLSRRG